MQLGGGCFVLKKGFAYGKVRTVQLSTPGCYNSGDDLALGAKNRARRVLKVRAF